MAGMPRIAPVAVRAAATQEWPMVRFEPERPDDLVITPIFARPELQRSIPRYRLPDSGSLPDTAYQLVHDAVQLDGNARQNLATFVTTWMDERAEHIYLQAADKNLIDKDEYPMAAEVEHRCWRMLADLWHAPDPARAMGTSTVGSSEAAMLGALALKKRWQAARRSAGKDTDRPNLVMSSAVQVCWEKFCNYFDVEARLVPIDDEHPVLRGDQLADHVDERTIGVVGILGVTYTGAYEPIAELAAALDQIQRDTGLDVPLHIDAASGGMLAPFLQPELEWDFRLERVASINTSGHKYGLVAPGVGWVVWREADLVPEEMVFHVAYLGGDTPSLTLNFSRPASQVMVQYYQFLRLGREGYLQVQQATLDVARHNAEEVDRMPEFSLYTRELMMPVVALQVDDQVSGWTAFDASNQLRTTGWQVPSYPLPDNLSNRILQRIVVRNGLSRDLADDLLSDIRRAADYLTKHGGDGERQRQFDHLGMPRPS